MADIIKDCKDCNTSFIITEEEKKWYESKHFELPERCSCCRAKRRVAKNNGGKNNERSRKK